MNIGRSPKIRAEVNRPPAQRARLQLARKGGRGSAAKQNDTQEPIEYLSETII